MAAPPISIKLRCASWRQVAAIYERDLLRNALFLRSAAPPPVGTAVRINLTLPTQTLIVLNGSIAEHIGPGGLDGRGPGVDINLHNVPHSALWLIESALSSARKSGTLGTSPVRPGGASQPSKPKAVSEHDIETNSDLVAAEGGLLTALQEELAAFRKLDPFKVLGVGYDAHDNEVRAAFAALTKRFHPDRYLRYESDEAYRTASEIFILVRNAYQHLDSAAKRARTREVLERRRAARHQGATRPAGARPRPRPAGEAVRRPAPAPPTPRTGVAIEGPTLPRSKPGQAPSRTSASQSGPTAAPAAAPAEGGAPDHVERGFALIERGKSREARELFKMANLRNRNDRQARIGLELAEGLVALEERDRLEAAQRFEVVLELDPDNEHAISKLAEMRQQATNERKDHMARLLKRKG